MKNLTKGILALTLVIFASANLVITSDSAVEEAMKEGYIADWEHAKGYSLEYIDAMPEDGINYKPNDQVRTFAEQYLHMAQGNIGLVGNATVAERIYPSTNLEKETKFHNKAELRRVTTEVYDWCIDAVKNMDMSKADEIFQAGNFKISRLEWMKKAFEHQTHHRGQTTVYLRMKGITPPPEKLF